MYVRCILCIERNVRVRACLRRMVRCNLTGQRLILFLPDRWHLSMVIIIREQWATITSRWHLSNQYHLYSNSPHNLGLLFPSRAAPISHPRRRALTHPHQRATRGAAAALLHSRRRSQPSREWPHHSSNPMHWNLTMPASYSNNNNNNRHSLFHRAIPINHNTSSSSRLRRLQVNRAQRYRGRCLPPFFPSLTFTHLIVLHRVICPWLWTEPQPVAPMWHAAVIGAHPPPPSLPPPRPCLFSLLTKGYWSTHFSTNLVFLIAHGCLLQLLSAILTWECSNVHVFFFSPLYFVTFNFECTCITSLLPALPLHLVLQLILPQTDLFSFITLTKQYLYISHCDDLYYNICQSSAGKNINLISFKIRANQKFSSIVWCKCWSYTCW